MIKTMILLLLSVAVVTRMASAQSTGRPILHDSIYSNILKEERMLEIVLPDDYRSEQAAGTGLTHERIRGKQ